MLVYDANNNNTYNNMNWASQIKDTLNNIGLSYLWEMQNANADYTHIKQRILDIYIQSWWANINNSRRLEPYSPIQTHI